MDRLKLISVSSAVNASIGEFFEGVIDNPKSGLISDRPTLRCSGWINPKGRDRSYSLKLLSSNGSVTTVAPNVPRKDVAKKKGFAPLANNSEFLGFNLDIPASEEVSIFVQINGEELLWKTISTTEIDFDVISVLSGILTNGQISNAELNKVELIDPNAVKNIAEVQVSNTHVVGPASNLISKILEPDEKFWFNKFIQNLESGDFLAQLLLSYSLESGIKIPSPFSDDLSDLVSTAYITDANFLIFKDNDTYFYIGQYLHTVDFVYFPEKALLLRFSHSHYEQKHLIGLISYCLKRPTSILKKMEHLANKSFGGLLLNGISPYHFFYDCLPALYEANRYNALKLVRHFFSIRGACYYPVENLFNLEADNRPYAIHELADLLSGKDQFFFIAGASYRQLDSIQIAEMDNQICKHASATTSDEILDATKKLNDCNPVLWVGISAQKRSWTNQIPALIKVLNAINHSYPEMGVVFDGMTANIYKSENELSDFSADRQIVNEITSELPDNLKYVSTVGYDSQAKIAIANLANFYISNYSTGSIYPARFCKIPGVCHLSNRMFNVVKDIHIHYNSSMIPFDIVEDIPDDKNPRLDFVSYSIDEEKLQEFILNTMSEKL